MRIEDLNELRDKNLISEGQHLHLGSILTRKIVSVYYELRILLYLGVMLFSTGVGILIYNNIGNLGHLLSIIALSGLTVGCFWYAFKFGAPYSDKSVNSPAPYFDYIVLLGCLLFISVLTYLQIQYEMFDDGMGAITLVTATFFFYIAYRFDHVGILSLAITALASFFSISVSPQKWYSGDFISESNHHNAALALGAVLAFAALWLDKKSIKEHFTFSYLNFASMMYLAGGLGGMFINDDNYFPYLLAVYAGCFAIGFYAIKTKTFLFILYAFVFGYIATTFVLLDILPEVFEFWFFYFIVSCGGFVAFVINYKKLFKRS
jgi:hypothetical protein